MTELTLEEKATNAETLTHIRKVEENIHKIIHLLLDRARDHDKSKLESPELEVFTKHTHNLKNLEYGTKAYEDNLLTIKPALDHHYAKNRHHAQHFKNGINDMNLVDIVEMLCDWRASTERNANGNILTSLEINAKKFGIDAQLLGILRNTVYIFEQQ